jgi:membrane AbrB-like protein
MVGAVVLAGLGSGVRVPAIPFTAAQAVIGCLMARAIPVSILSELGLAWPIFVLGVGSVIAAAMGIGALLTKLDILPGTTAVWGTSPGGATPMVLLADEFGADSRLVAFMQYVRVIAVAVAASIVARLWAPGDAAAVAAPWFPAVNWIGLGETLGLAAVGFLIGRFTRLPAGAMLGPFFLGIVLQDTGLMTIELPPVLLTVCYAVIGWTIGLKFTRPIILHALRTLPLILVSTVSLIAICGGIAALLVAFAGVDPLTAYLATSPGGADSVAIIASNSNVDLPFVMSMQAARLIVLLLLGPSIARVVAHLVRPREVPL